MRKTILISLILIVIISIFGILCTKVLATLSSHMCNLSMYGWIYFFFSIGVSYLLSISLKRFIPKWMRYITKKRYPDFSLLIVPEDNVSIAVFLFFLLFAFCGYFSEQENDISFFLTVGGMLSVYGMLATFKGHLFMVNQKTVFVSTFAMAGLYKRLEFEKVTKVDVQGKYWEICNKKTNKALFRIYMDSYSEHGQTKINEWLNIIQ